MLRDWTWNMGGNGPDYVFSAQFDVSGADQVAALITDSSLAKSTVEIKGNSLQIISFNWHHEGTRAETSLIATLCTSPNLTIGQWQIGFGGEGYNPGTIAAGSGAEELLEYLQPRALPKTPPNFPNLERALRRILAEREIAALFELNEFEAKRWMCQATIHYASEASSEASRIVREQGTINFFAGCEPFRAQMDDVTRRVDRASSIPGRVARALSNTNEIVGPDPSGILPGFFKPVGFVLQFGYSMDMGWYDNENEFAAS